MCTSCGCSHGQLRIEGTEIEGTEIEGPETERSSVDVHSVEGQSGDYPFDSHQKHVHSHDSIHHDGHSHNDSQQSGSHLHFGQGPARSHAPGLSQTRMVQIEQSILSKNDEYAVVNRSRLIKTAVLALNLVSSPGSGKTTLLTRTLGDIKDRIALAVIEGDQETANDAERIRKTGVQAIQVNTGKGCHLDAHMVGHALDKLSFEGQGILFIENVGNLVCPASFDLGEAHKVAILSVTEGEDKPLKYPDMFHASDLLLLNKVDLLPHLDFDVELCIENALKVNPNIEVIRCSATSGEGMDQWYQWLEKQRVAQLQQQLQPLKERIQQIEASLSRGII